MSITISGFGIKRLNGGITEAHVATPQHEVSFASNKTGTIDITLHKTTQYGLNPVDRLRLTKDELDRFITYLQEVSECIS